MPVLKYWNGTSWVRLLDQGAAPSAPNPPPYQGQVGSILTQGTAGIGDLNAGGAGFYDIGTVSLGAAVYTTQIFVVAAIYAGYGGGDTALNADIYALGPNAVAAASPSPIHCHAGWWIPIPIVANWQVSPGMDQSFKLRCNQQWGSNWHTSGGVNWIVTRVA